MNKIPEERKLREQLEKAWDLVEDLEQENFALSNSVKNVYAETGGLREQIALLTRRNDKLKSDNDFLKKMVLRSNRITSTDLGQMLKKYETNKEI